jgi:antitoxin component YwqK of YwqJK toxin-antitoxin module
MKGNSVFANVSNENARALFIVMAFFVFVIVALTVISNKLRQEVDTIETDKPAITVAPQTVKAQNQAQKRKAAREITRQTIVVRGNDFVEHWFYDGEEVVAKQRVGAAGVIDTEGEIPDGIVKFTDTYKNTYGEERYEDGVREGPSATYYQDGKLKETAKFEKGRMVSSIEYYADGSKRFELDTSDARLIEGDREVGVGKLYWPNGQLKYEWYMTRRDPIGYKKSYNREGQLRHATYFDENNEEIRKDEPSADGVAL